MLKQLITQISIDPLLGFVPEDVQGPEGHTMEAEQGSGAEVSAPYRARRRGGPGRRQAGGTWLAFC